MADETLRLQKLSRPGRFLTRAEIDRYFGGRMIKCLLCGERFGRLASHLAYKHGMSADQYRSRFGLPWTRGLTSAASHRNSGWTKRRRIDAGQLARQTRFFEFADRTSRRDSPECVKQLWLDNLGAHAVGFGPRFEQRVRRLFNKELIDREIAEALGVNRMTVNQLTRKWRRQIK